MASKTKKPTGLSITRSGNTYTFKWKIAAKNYGGGQQLKYSYTTGNSGAGATVYPAASATSYSITVANVKSISFSIRGKRKKENNTTYEYSDWASASWNAVAPKAPTLTYKNEGTNKGTISWSCPNDASDTAAFTGAEYQTCIERNAGASGFGGAAVQSKGAVGSELVIESSADMAAGNFVRWFRIRPYGPGGYGPWATTYHAYGAPMDARITGAEMVYTYGSSSRIKVSWSLGYNTQYPVDELTLQYVTAAPTDAAMTAPVSGWSDAVKLDVKLVNDSAVVNIPDAVGDDECMWVRIVADHDGLKSYSAGYIAAIGRLKAPAIDAVPDVSTGDVSITITEATSCNVAATAIFFRPEEDPSRDRIIAILPNGTTTTTVNVPDIVGATHTCFGAYAFVGTYSGTKITGIRMRSDAATDSDIPAVPPANVTVVDGPAEGTVRVAWDWSWVVATKAELSWSTEDYAWESTAEPTKYKIEEVKANSWIIAGLEVGKQYYFRVRLIDESADTPNVGPWSDIISYKLLGVPGKPILTLNKSVINSGDTLTARWATAMSGNETQAYAEICLVTYDDDTGDPVYGDVIARAETEQSTEISYEWETNETYALAIRITLSSGSQSEWSDPVNVYIVPPVGINVTTNIYVGRVTSNVSTITTTYVNDVMTGRTTQPGTWQRTVNFAGTEVFEQFISGGSTETNVSVEDDTTTVVIVRTTHSFENRPTLMQLPLVVTITGAGATGTTVLSIVRAEDYHIDRPDERDYDGYYGEIVATYSQVGEAAISISADDLIGSLSDGAGYYLVGKVVDEYGQSASFQYPFWVDWTHKAVAPSVIVEMDPYSRITKITPIRVTGISNDDVCDIYRMSADKPELIVKGATFGETYVDPHPAFGEVGGHRLVTITTNGDYTTSGGLAWYDTGIDDGDVLYEEAMVIDVDGEQIVLPYNLELSNKWNKDFKRTSYLGGSVQGDWNPAVTRDLSANTVLVRGDDLDRQLAMRDLAGYAGIAYVRTPDGSSLTANVQIDERQSYDSRKVSYTLAMQAIDPEALDGMTLTEWEELHPIVEP